MEKLVLAEDTSNVDDVSVSSSELRERGKKRRRTKARKWVSSSSSSEDDSINISRNEDNVLPALPTLHNFNIDLNHRPNVSTNIKRNGELLKLHDVHEKIWLVYFSDVRNNIVIAPKEAVPFEDGYTSGKFYKCVHFFS